LDSDGFAVFRYDGVVSCDRGSRFGGLGVATSDLASRLVRWNREVRNLGNISAPGS